MVKSRVDLLVLGSRETVTVDGDSAEDLGVIEDGGVAINEGKIVRAAASQLLERKFEARTVIDASDEIILPGLVDPHTHLVFNGSREDEFQLRMSGVPYIEILKRGGGILETVRKTRLTSESELVSLGLKRMDSFIEAGSTTVEAKSGYGLRTLEELKILRTMRKLSTLHPCRLVPTFLGAHAIPSDRSAADYIREVVSEMLPLVVRERLARFCDVFCERGAFDAKQSQSILNAASKMGLHSKIHADEFSSIGGIGVAVATNCTSADHLIHSQMDDFVRLRKAEVIPVLLPASSHSLLSREHANAREMLSLGLPVALGTDFSPANWVTGQLTTAALAARELRMGVDEIIRGITINAARAVEMQASIGSLSEGKRADLVTLRVPNHKWIGYGYGEGVVDKVLIEGRLKVQNGKRLN
jgi:imidazolonepropionase